MAFQHYLEMTQDVGRKLHGKILYNESKNNLVYNVLNFILGSF